VYCPDRDGEEEARLAVLEVPLDVLASRGASGEFGVDGQELRVGRGEGVLLPPVAAAALLLVTLLESDLS
jgi:hypothetical protein